MHLGSALLTSRSGARPPEHAEYPTQSSNHQNRTNFHRAPQQAHRILPAQLRWVLHIAARLRPCIWWNDDRGQGCPETLRKTPPHCPLASLLWQPEATRSAAPSTMINICTTKCWRPLSQRRSLVDVAGLFKIPWGDENPEFMFVVDRTDMLLWKRSLQRFPTGFCLVQIQKNWVFFIFTTYWLDINFTKFWTAFKIQYNM